MVCAAVGATLLMLAAGAEVREGGEKGKAGASGGWDVLSDGYLMGRNKLKDWDKGAEEGATEVEYEDEDAD